MPARQVKLKSFYLDVHEVSNLEFELFINATDYVTEAEIFGNSFVADYYLTDTVKSGISEAVAAAPWWLPVQVTYRHRSLSLPTITLYFVIKEFVGPLGKVFNLTNYVFYMPYLFLFYPHPARCSRHRYQYNGTRKKSFTCRVGHSSALILR
jgi:hypothetical protein